MPPSPRPTGGVPASRIVVGGVTVPASRCGAGPTPASPRSCIGITDCGCIGSMLGGTLGAGIVDGGCGAEGGGSGAGSGLTGAGCAGSGFGTCGAVGLGDGAAVFSEDDGTVGFAGGWPCGGADSVGTASIGGGFVSGSSVSRDGSDGPIAVD